LRRRKLINADGNNSAHVAGNVIATTFGGKSLKMLGQLILRTRGRTRQSFERVPKVQSSFHVSGDCAAVLTVTVEASDAGG
jgi:hypothetical protein